MHIAKVSVNGQPNVGLAGYATDSYLLFGEHVPDRIEKDIREALGGIELHQIRIAGTSMPGIFLAGNSKTLLVPAIAFATELATLDKLGIAYTLLETRQTCLGNNIACNEHGAIISTDFTEAERKKIEAALGVPALRMDIAGLKTPGAVLLTRGGKGIIHRDASDEEVAAIEKLMNVTLEPATVNLGTPYLHAAVLHNTHGFAISDACGGPEIVHIDEALGYMEDEDDA